LPGGVGKKLGGALGKPASPKQASEMIRRIRLRLFEVLEKGPPATLVFPGTFADAENVPITAIIDADRD
jgi:hypothetical protein